MTTRSNDTEFTTLLDVTHTVAPDGRTLTLRWTPVPGAGYELWIDGVRQKSFSRDAAKKSWVVAKQPGLHTYEVRAVVYGPHGSVKA